MNKRTLAAAGAILLILAGCTGAPPSEVELSVMRSAPKPSSRAAVERAVQRFFDLSLIDAPAARWRYPRPPVRSNLSFGGLRQFGWFVCGEINGKNRMGGYTGWHIFMAYFSPDRPDTVADGSIEHTDPSIVPDWCASVYRNAVETMPWPHQAD